MTGPSGSRGGTVSEVETARESVAGQAAPSGLRTPAIAGLGVAVPERVLTNSDLEKMVDTSDEWIRTRTGIRERRLVEPGTPTSDLAAGAAREALSSAGVAPADVDLIVVGTFTGDCPSPSTACAVQEKLGATRAAAFDLNAMCSGFVYGLAVGSQFVRTGAAERVLVIGADILSSVTDYTDRNTCILFGDGAGAAVLAPGASARATAGPTPGGAGDVGRPRAEPGRRTPVGAAHEILHTSMASDGSGFRLLWQPAGGSRKPASPETVAAREHFLRMEGREIFKIAVRKFQETIRRATDAAGWGLDEVDLIVPHQVNTRIIDAIVERLGIAHEKVYQNLERYGNTSAASIPLALWEAEKEGKLKPGDKVVLAAVGGGITWGSAAILW